MPVEFECPHCQATMRTPDRGMGQKIGCAKCHGLLLVPTVEIPRSAIPDTAQLDRDTINQQLQARADEAVFDPTTISPSTSPSQGRPRYRRRKRSTGGWAALLVVLLVLGAAYGIYVYFQGSGGSLTGTLTATTVDLPDLTRELTLPEGPGADAALALLDDEPVAVTGPTYRLEMTAAGGEESRDVSVEYIPDENSKVVEVDLNAAPAAAAYLASNGERLKSRVVRAVREETAAFAAGEVDRGDAARFLERTASLTHVQGVGAFVLGGAGSVGYPVVREPEHGVLQFVVPLSLKRLDLLPAASRGDVLPQGFFYQVTLP